MSARQNKLGYSLNDYFDAFQNYFEAQSVPLVSLEAHERTERFHGYYSDPGTHERSHHIYLSPDAKCIRAAHFFLKTKVLGKREFLLSVGEQMGNLLRLDIHQPEDLEAFSPEVLVGKAIALQQGIIALEAESAEIRNALRGIKKP